MQINQFQSLIVSMVFQANENLSNITISNFNLGFFFFFEDVCLFYLLNVSLIL
jgi:hypothetical protein